MDSRKDAPRKNPVNVVVEVPIARIKNAVMAIQFKGNLVSAVGTNVYYNNQLYVMDKFITAVETEVVNAERFLIFIRLSQVI